MALAPCLGQRHTQRDVPCNMSEIRCRLCSSEMTALQTKRDVPIVFTIAPDPGAGFVESLELPGAARNGHRRSADQRVESGALVSYGAPADQRHSSRGRAKRSR